MESSGRIGRGGPNPKVWTAWYFLRQSELLSLPRKMCALRQAGDFFSMNERNLTCTVPWEQLPSEARHWCGLREGHLFGVHLHAAVLLG